MASALSSILKSFCKTPCHELRNEEPRFELFDAARPNNRFNLEKYHGWRVIGEPDGLYDLAERQFVEESSRYRDGVTNQATSLKKRTLTFRVEICACEACDLLTHQSELYRGVRCQNCEDVECNEVECLGGNDCALPTSSGCILRVNCCGADLMTEVRLLSAKRTSRQTDKCAIYEIKFQQDEPRWFSSLQRLVIRPNDETLFNQSCFTSVLTCQNQRWETCVTVPYSGDMEAFPRIYMAGQMQSPSVTNQSTGANINLNNSGLYFLPKCNSLTLTFWSGEQSYETTSGENLFPLLSASCRRFSFSPCPDGVEICISAEQVDPCAIVIIDYFNYYESFGAAIQSAGVGC